MKAVVGCQNVWIVVSMFWLVQWIDRDAKTPFLRFISSLIIWFKPLSIFLSRKLAYPMLSLWLQVQAMSAQGRGNYSDPTSITVESFPAGFIGASAAGAVLICCGLAILVVLTLMIGHCCKIRIRCVHMCVATAIMPYCLYTYCMNTHYTFRSEWQHCWVQQLSFPSCRSHEKAESSSNPSLYEVPLDSNPCYAMTVLNIESSMFVAGQLVRHSSASSNDSLSEEWEGSPEYENVTNVSSMLNH